MGGHYVELDSLLVLLLDELVLLELLLVELLESLVLLLEVLELDCSSATVYSSQATPSVYCLEPVVRL